MGFTIAKALLLVQLSLICFPAVFGEETEALPPIPPKPHDYYHYPAVAPSHPPSHHHHHHGHPPSHPPSHHHQHHGHPPSQPPVHSPVLAPVHQPKAQPPPVHPPVPAPVHPPKPQPSPVHPPMRPPPVVHPSPPVHPPFPRSFIAVQGVVYCKSCKYVGVDTLIGASPVLGATVKLQCNNTKYPQEVKATTDKNGYFFLEAPKTITNYGAHKCKVFLVSAPNTACSKPSDLHGGLSGGILRPEKSYVSKNLPFVLFTVGPFAFEPKCPH